MTVEELRQSIEDHLPNEMRLPGIKNIANHVTQQIRAYGLARRGWSFDFERGRLALEDEYDTGTLSVNGGSTSVTGSGTTWTDITLNRHKIRLSGVPYRISTIGGDTSITLENAYQGDDLSDESYTIYRDEFAISSLTQLHTVWDVTNARKVQSRNRREIGQRDTINDNSGDVLMYALVGRDSSDNHILQFQPYPTAAATIEYWYTKDYTRVTDIGDSIDLPSQFDPLLRQGGVARAMQTLRMNGWREEMQVFDEMLVQAYWEDQPQREEKIRLMRTDRLDFTELPLISSQPVIEAS